MPLEEILLLIQFMQISKEVYLTPYDGKKDLENGKINFIGNAETRIKEDYLRVLRYVRFFLVIPNIVMTQKLLKQLKKI